MKKEHCPNCGQSIMKHKQSLSKSLILILIKSAQSGMRSFHLQKDLNFTHNQYANFQKLKYWHLVSREGEPSGNWHITDIGYDFLSGKLKLYKCVWTFNNKVSHCNGVKEVFIYDIGIGPFNYKQREDYAKDAQQIDGVGQVKLF